MAVRDAVATLHQKMRVLVAEIAKRIEGQKYKSSQEAVENLSLSRAQKNKATALVSADEKIHVSCQSLKVTVELFCELNKQIVKKLESSKDFAPADEGKLILGNALLVYELTDFAIQFIENFRLAGLDEVETIHKEMLKTIGTLRDEQQSLRKQAESPDIEDFLKQQVLFDIDQRNESIQTLEAEWSAYMETIGLLKGETAHISKKIPGLRLIRDNAKAQINTLAAVAVLQIVRSNIHTIEATVLQLEKIQLASLSADRVKRLLGIRT